MNNKLSKLEKKIGIYFKNKSLLVKSLTHKSFNPVKIFYNNFTN